MAPGDRAGSRILHRYLLDDEQVVVATRRHWGRLLEPVATTAGTFLLLAWASAPLERLVGEPALLLWWGWSAVLARLAWKVLEWRQEWFVATDRRLLMTYGLLTHKVAMMPLRKVTDLNYARSPFGRLLGYGEFVLESAGQDQAMRAITWLPDPDRAYRRICDTIFGAGVQGPRGALHEEPDLGSAAHTDSPWAPGAPWVDPAADGPVGVAGEPQPRQPSPPVRPSRAAAASRSSPADAGWEVSTEDADQYVPVRVASRPRRRPLPWPDDPDATGPIPRPGRARPTPPGTT